MTKYIFKNISGDIILDEKLTISQGTNDSLEALPISKSNVALKYLKNIKNFAKFREENIKITKKSIRDSLKWDLLVIQSIRTHDDLIRTMEILIKRIREWYEYYNPEFSWAVTDSERFIKQIINKDKDELLKILNLNNIDSMGADFEEHDLVALKDFAKTIEIMLAQKQVQIDYIRSSMEKFAPNILTLTGPVIGAKLLEIAGSIDRLALMPASTVQLLGAEKALFRHIKTGAKCPKYGILLQHHFVGTQPKHFKGKAARALADKISICAKVDRFSGDFMADQLKEKLEKKFGTKI